MFVKVANVQTQYNTPSIVISVCIVRLTVVTIYMRFPCLHVSTSARPFESKKNINITLLCVKIKYF